MVDNSNIEIIDKLKRFREDLEKILNPEVEIVSLRPKLTKSAADLYKGDFDYIVREKDLLKLMNILYDYCKNNGINFILNQKPKNKRIFNFFIDDFLTSSVTVEFWITVEFTYTKRKAYFSTDDIFEVLNKENTSSQEILSLLYILHLHHKKKDLFSEENLYRCNHFQNRIKKKSLGQEIFKVFEKLENKELTLTEANDWAVKELNSLGLRNSTNFKKDLRFFQIRMRNKILNIKKIIPLIGPDGVGKGSVSDQAIKNLKGWSWFPFKLLYRVRIFYRMRLSFVPNWKSNPNNENDEKIKGYIFLTAFFNIRMLALLKKDKILLDRYFTDYFASPIRYPDEEEEPKKMLFYKTFLKLTPMTNHMVFLGCTNKSLVERKNELPIKSVTFLQNLNCEFIIKKTVPSILFLSTENPVSVSSNVLFNYLKRIGYGKN